MTKDKNIHRITVPKNLFLPKVTLKRYSHYEVKTTRKKTYKHLKYTDYAIEFLQHMADIAELMESRPRFKNLVSYTEKILKAKGHNEYHMRYVINAQNINDCRLAVIYINYYLSKSYDLNIDCSDFSKTYEYHTRWEDELFYGINMNFDGDATEDEAVLHKPVSQSDGDESNSNDYPEWWQGFHPVFISYDAVQKYIESDDFINGYSLIYVLDPREKTTRRSSMDMSSGFGCLDEPELSTRNPQELLAIQGFKSIYIPNADKNELKNLFEAVSSRMGMRISKSLKFEPLIEQYGNYFNTEYDLRGIIKAIKEHKIFNCALDTPVTYKDFESVCNPLKEAQLKNAETNKKKKCIGNPWDELKNLIGCDAIKKETRRMVDFLLLDKRRRELGLKSAQLTKHSVFFGSPGTAKTTVARLIARIMAHEGIISNENFKECQKSDVVGQYVGWTAAGVDGMFKEMDADGGGVIFFDEAYTYAERDSTCFDVEAVNCIVQNLENYRSIMCIFAGYKEPMKRFVETNPGLRSRIGFTFEFENFDALTTYKIAQHQAKSLNFKLPDSCEDTLIEYFNTLIKLQGEHFGNGRCARLLIENAGLQLASRLAQQRRKPGKNDCTRLITEDIELAIKSSLERERAFGQKHCRKIGFCSTFD